MASVLLHLRELPVATKTVMALTSILSLGTMVARWQTDGDWATQWEHDPARFVQLRTALVTRYPWTLATTTFVEPNVLLLVYGLCMLATVGRFLEQQWGTRGYLQFLLVLSTIPSVTTLLALILLSFVKNDAEILYTTAVGGLAAVLSGFTVGLKQLAPDYTVKVFRGALGFRVNDLPGLYTLVFPIIFTLLGQLGGVLLVNLGFFVAFVFLRFYRRSGSVLGDRSAAFAFCSFFPEFAQPVIRRISDVVYRGAVACGVITSEEGYVQQNVGMDSLDVRVEGPAQFADLEEVVAEDPAVGAAAESEADRRRALATKALDMRLAASPAPDPRMLLPGQLLVGAPHAVSNIRPLRLSIPSDETPAERTYREQRQAAAHQDHVFWQANNQQFEQGKQAFEQQVRAERGECTLDDLSVYYRRYQEESYARHVEYNRAVWRRNVAMVWPGVRAWWQEVWRRRARRRMAVAGMAGGGTFYGREGRGDVRRARGASVDGAGSVNASTPVADVDRRAEKIKSYY
ncbi:hypothetical protein GGI15_003602 [Coemansia interrupta]|uniref:Uncharacterized protein n=1 Tax=Coemansia interrupta TaxID=1126814 RepID=A0A9W8HF05_9FUNG|nr:hypothetical protein GGI15_003602 [Coemansia interrupta]